MHHGHSRFSSVRRFVYAISGMLISNLPWASKINFTSDVSPFGVRLSACAGANFDALYFKTLRDDTDEVMPTMLIENWMLSRNCVSNAYKRGHCRVSRYAIPTNSRLHGFRLFLCILNTSPVSRDKMFENVLGCLDLSILRCKLIPSHGKSPISR